MKSTDTGDRKPTELLALNSSINAAPLTNQNDTIIAKPTTIGHISTYIQGPSVLVNHQVANQLNYSHHPDQQRTMNILNYNKSVPLRPRPIAPANTIQQTWQGPQFVQQGTNAQVHFSLPIQCKPVNGFITQTVFQKVQNDGYIGNGHDQLQIQVASQLAVGKSLESSLPSEVMQTPLPAPSKKESSKKSQREAKSSGKATCLSPVSDFDMENSNSNAEFPNGTPTSSTKKSSSTPSSKGKKSSSTSNNCSLQQEMTPAGIFNKIASLGSEPDRRYFLSQLFTFMTSAGTPIKVMPVVCRQTVDLYKLYNIVKGFGGLEKVCKMKQWRDVSSSMGFGGSTSAGFALKKNYCKYLFSFECKYDRNDVDPNPILVSLDLVSKLETKKKSQESGQSSQDPLIKEDSVSQDSVLESSSGVEEFPTFWEKPNDQPAFFSIGSALPYVFPVNKSHSETPCNPETRLKPVSNNQATATPVEYTHPTRFKRRKLNHHDCGSIDMHKVTRSLASGLLAETTWALDYLSIVSHDPTTLTPNLSKHQKLFSLLVDLFCSCLERLTKTISQRECDAYSVGSDSSNSSEKDEPSDASVQSSSGSNQYYVFSPEYSPHQRAGFFGKKHSRKKSEKVLLAMPTSQDENCDSHHSKVLSKCNIPDILSEGPRRPIEEAINSEIKREALEPDEDLLASSDDMQNELVKRCICISNILRNMAAAVWNEKVIAGNVKLLSALCFCLHFNHKHFVRKPSQSEKADRDDAAEELEQPQELSYTFWPWSVMANLRSNCLVILSHITNHLDLSPLSGDLCFQLCGALLHWSVCQSSEALDHHSGLNISIQCIAFEALSKLCISRHNVDYVIAAPPFSRVVYFINQSVKLIHQDDSEIVRDMLLGILCRFIEAENNVARVLAIDGCAPLILLGLIDDYIDLSIVESTNSTDGLLCEATPPKVSSYTACKAAEILCLLSRVRENIPLLSKFKKHLIDIATSSVDDELLMSTIAEIMAAVC